MKIELFFTDTLKIIGNNYNYNSSIVEDIPE